MKAQAEAGGAEVPAAADEAQVSASENQFADPIGGAEASGSLRFEADEPDAKTEPTEPTSPDEDAEMKSESNPPHIRVRKAVLPPKAQEPTGDLFQREDPEIFEEEIAETMEAERADLEKELVEGEELEAVAFED